MTILTFTFEEFHIIRFDLKLVLILARKDRYFHINFWTLDFSRKKRTLKRATSLDPCKFSQYPIPKVMWVEIIRWRYWVEERGQPLSLSHNSPNNKWWLGKYYSSFNSMIFFSFIHIHTTLFFYNRKSKTTSD